MGYGRNNTPPVEINLVNEDQLNELQYMKEADPLNVREFGALGEGQINEAPGIKGAIALAATMRKKTIKIPDGTYNIHETIIVDRGLHLVLDANAILKVKADVHAVQIMPNAKMSGGVIDASTIYPYTKACIYMNGDDIYKLLNDHVYCSGTMLMGPDREYSDQNFTGTGIHLYSGKGSNGNPSYVSFVHFRKMGIFNFEYGIRLEVDETITSDSEFAWVNGNVFDGINMMNCVKGITLNGDSNIPRDCVGNLFNNLQVQVNSYSEWAVNVIGGGWNRFEGSFWDLHRQPVGTKGFRFGQKTRFNEIYGMHGYESRHWEDKGYLNKIVSMTNHIPDNRNLFHPFPVPYEPNSLGNQDDYMAHGHLRGYTVNMMQTTSPDRNPTVIHPAGVDEIEYESGNYDALFTLSTEAGVRWDGSQADYDNPIVIEIDMTADPVPLLGHLGFVSAYGNGPKNALFEVFDGTSWVEHGDWRTDSEYYMHVSAPWAVGETIQRIRLSMWNPKNPDGTIQISRIFAMSTGGPGKAFVEAGGGDIYGDLVFHNGRTIAFDDGSGNLTYLEQGSGKQTALPPVIFDKTMIGDIDDVLPHANTEYTVTQLSGAAPSNGSLASAFNMDKNIFVGWNDFTNPVVIQIDFNPNPLRYIGLLALLFSGEGTDSPTGIKVEYTTTNGGTWKTMKDITNNTSASVTVTNDGILANIYQLKITFTSAPTDVVKLYRIMATSGEGKGKTYLSTQGGTVRGDVTHTKKVKHTGDLVIPARTSDPTSPEVGTMWLRTDL